MFKSQPWNKFHVLDLVGPITRWAKLKKKFTTAENDYPQKNIPKTLAELQMTGSL